MEDTIIQSPNLLHRAVMKYLGEIRYGPAYYSLTIDTISFGNRAFGNSHLWSFDSRYFAIQVWETTRESRGLQTRLLLIDLDPKQECVLSRAERSFIVPQKFEKINLFMQKNITSRTRSKNSRLRSSY